MMAIRVEPKPVIFQFDRFQVDPLTFRLLKDGTPVDVEPKALHLLIYLLQHPGRLVKKQELLDAVWGDTSVTENALTRAIAILRRALNDSTREPKYIETVPTQGYRFVADVSTSSDTGLRQAEADAPRAAAASTSLLSGKRVRIAIFAAAIVTVVVAGLLWHRARNRDRGAAGQSTEVKRFGLVQVTFSGGLDGFPGFSPDGRSIVFSSDRSGVFELYIRQLEENGGEVQLTRDGGGNIQPEWSPDGQWIAYHSLKNGGIWVVPALGGMPRRLADFGSQPSWSHAGTQIAFQSGEFAAASESNVSAMPGATIWIADLSGGSPRQLTNVSTTASLFTVYGDGRPRWLPDDKRILFENSGELWTIATDGTDLRPVRQDRFAYDPALSEDGHTVYFLGEDSEGSGLWRVEIKPDWTASGPSVKLHNSAPAAAQHLAYGPGGKFAFSIMSTLDNLYSISIMDKGGFGEPVALTQDTRLRKTWPQFSPDGSKIALFVGQRGRSGQLWVIRPDGKDAQQIPIGEKAFEPEWCGTSAICYWSSKDRQGTTLSRWDLDQGRSARVMSTPEIMSAIRRSPDGKTAAFQKGMNGAINVWLLALDSGKVRPLTSTRGVTGWPSWSPDGRSLAVEIRDGANTQIGIVSASGGTARLVTQGAGQNWPYSWSPDGKAIAFAGSRAGVWNVYSVDASTGAIRQLTHNTGSTSFVRYPEWSPTGRQIVYEYGASTANIWLLEPRK